MGLPEYKAEELTTFTHLG